MCNTYGGVPTSSVGRLRRRLPLDDRASSALPTRLSPDHNYWIEHSLLAYNGRVQDRIVPKSPAKRKRVLRVASQTLLRRRTIVGVVLALFLFAHLTNPFTAWTIVREPFATSVDPDGNIRLTEQEQLRVRSAPGYQGLAAIKATTHIVNNVYTGSKKTASSELESIIDEIHTTRFDPAFPYLISGDHFSVLYPRSLGIFYASTLDPRTARSSEDWLNRQSMYLKTTAYALEVFDHTETLATTIVPIGPKATTTINVYATPSDTLYSLLYALDVMTDPSVIPTLYPTAIKTDTVLHTKIEAQRLLTLYRPMLKRHYDTYRETILDPSTGIVRTDILLSGTKDIIKREGAFYDNVVYWKTTQLAQKLGIIEKDSPYLATLKSKILTTYWDEAQGFFLEDLSQESLLYRYYSSDWLIAFMTGFLDPTDPTERTYYRRSVDYIIREKIDLPFGLRYQQENRSERAYLGVRIFAPSYGGTAIWSHWGMEYCKLLILLSKLDNEPILLERAEEQLTWYSQNMVKYRGFPEVYDKSGEMFANPFYKSVRKTGWVVNFEQARLMLDDAQATSKVFAFTTL